MENLLDFTTEILDIILSNLPYPERLQFNRVCTRTNYDVNKTDYVNYFKQQVKTNFKPFTAKLREQIQNPFWVEKYGLLPLPLCAQSIFEKQHQNLFLEALQQNDFPTIRAIMILFGPKYIVLECPAKDLPFYDKIKDEYDLEDNSNMIFCHAWLYPHSFGANLSTSKKIYNLVKQIQKTEYIFGYPQSILKLKIKNHIKQFDNNQLFTLLQNDLDYELKQELHDFVEIDVHRFYTSAIPESSIVGTIIQ